MDRAHFTAWYLRNRARSHSLFDLLGDAAYYSRPIELRHPIVFYEGHLPTFSFNTLVKKALGGASIDRRLEELFARGIDPGDSRGDSAAVDWPSRDLVRQFAEEADRRVLDALAVADLERSGDPLLDRAEAVFAIIEHEAMHQETLLYMWHRLPLEQKRRPVGYRPNAAGLPPVREWVDVPQGRATLGVNRDTIPFGWDNEFGRMRSMFPDSRLNGTTSRTRHFSSSSRPAATATHAGGGPRTGTGCRRTASIIRCSGRTTTASGSGAGCSNCSRCRVRGPCTSVTRRRLPTQAGAARGCRPRPNSSARRTALRMAASDPVRGGRAPGADSRCVRLHELGS